ncbi:hypothetical protein [Haloferula sargassicola]|uniref:Verru_Chthon cassette protein A n=1 Tax=Haloferula sargassicola TaxID=490096 RepID=A0ABP9US57_9BACT
MKSLSQPTARRSDRGFALIIVIALMVLLSLLAVGLLGLSSVTLRSSRGGDAMAVARANARMALTVAIGNLQKAMGPDQRVSANSSAVNGPGGEANLLGAWDSWHWNPESANSPDYTDKRGGFVRWLASTADEDLARDIKAPTQQFDDPVWLINPETVGQTSTDPDATNSLRANRQRVQTTDQTVGGLAWGVMDESQKVAIALKGEDDEDLQVSERIAQRVAPQRAAPEVFLPGMQQLAESEYPKLVTLDTASLALGTGTDKTQILGRQEAITTQSIGLLTNVADGGVKWDLTSLFEGDPARELGRETLYFSEADGAPTWDYLQSHYALQERISGSAGGVPSVTLLRSELRPKSIGLDVAPTSETLLPVVAKMQIVFSLVTHYSHLPDRVQFYNTQASPRGNTRYGVPHLVYDPVITLWNPYDVAIRLEQLRIRLWDPPVLFGFKKNQNWLRDEFASGNYQGLARFQIKNEHEPSARRWFTFLLTESRGGANPQPGGTIVMQPGEVKVFSPWVEGRWTWGYEIAAGDPRSFFDWRADSEFGNVDNRTKNKYGVETIPGWDPRAGLQTDHLSYSDARPPATIYQTGDLRDGWVAIRTDHEVSVFCKAGRAFPATGSNAKFPDFQMDLLAGVREQPERDIIRSYKFRFNNVESEVGGLLNNNEITRTYQVGDLLQTPDDSTPGGKTPFALFSVSAKTTKDVFDFTKPWMHAHPVNEGGEQDTREIGNAMDAYDVSLREVSSFYDFPMIEIDSQNRGYLGGTSRANGGVSNVPMFHVPVLPSASLGDLIPANLVASGALPRFTHPFGNSYSHPLIPTDRVSVRNPVTSTTSGVRFGNMLDHSYLLNDALWDRFYFSTIGEIQNDVTGNQSTKGLLTDFLEENPRQLNRRLVPIVNSSSNTESTAQEIANLPPAERARKMATVMGVPGAFNVNSDSKDAWWAMLTSLRDRAVVGWGDADLTADGKTAYPRASFPLAGDPDDQESGTSVDVEGAKRWAGFRALTDDQLENLAESIVEQIQARGSTDEAPFCTLGEFVNRRIGGSSGLHTVKGLLQTAIEESSINDEFHRLDSNTINGSSQLLPNATKGEQNTSARLGFSAEGAPSIVSQGDLMMALAPVATVRGDTFRIRAYGESRDPADRITAQAYCEATVQRVPDYVDPVDQAEILPDELTSEVNQKFGRRFILTGFRWLSPDEI